MKNIIVTMDLDDQEKEQLVRAAGPDTEILFAGVNDIGAADLAEAEAVVGKLTMSQLDLDLPKLKLLQLDSAGADNFAAKAIFHKEGAPVLCNATGAYGITISEQLVGYTIMLLRHYDVYRDNMHKHAWSRTDFPEIIYGKNVLVVGTGDIGSNYAKRIKAFGAHVTGIKRTVKEGETVEGVDELYTLDQLPFLLPQMDIIACALPNSPQTTKIFNKETLAKCKETAILLNVGRGTAIDSDALAEALNAHKLGGAALDVTDPEPLPEDHALWDCPNCLITPHMAGLAGQRDPKNRILDICCKNLAHLAKGEAFENVVDISTGYKAH